MAIESIPVWSFPANWASTLTEAFEWLTDVLTSAKGAEQRRCLRVYPRRTIEFSVAVAANERTFFDQFLTTHGARNLYLPLWQEAYRTNAPLTVGASVLLIDDADNGGIASGDILFIGDGSARRFELVEVASVTSVGVTLVSGVTKSWSAFASVHPVRKARLDDQPTLRRVTDEAVTFTVTFRIMQRNDDAGFVVTSSVTTDLLQIYDGFNVLASPPDEREALEVGITRLVDMLDNDTGIPAFNDVGGIPFKNQKFNWVHAGRDAYSLFKKTLYHLRGRTVPIWLPTFFSDMRMVENTESGDSSIKIEGIGFTATGGAQLGRAHLMITRTDGTNSFHHILGSAIDGDNEFIGLDTVFSSGLLASDVLRISFMQLCRLDQDRVEIVHHTDTQGTSLCTATFRAAPNIRQVLPGF